MKVADIVSLSLILLLAYPWVMYGTTFEDLYGLWGAGMLFTALMNHVVKLLLGTRHPMFMRPKGAHDCYLFNNGGDCGNEPGFPSGHVATSVSFFALGWLFTQHIEYVVFGVVYTYAMCWSRVERECHTVLQTIFGVISGILFSYLFFTWVAPHMQKFLHTRKK